MNRAEVPGDQRMVRRHNVGLVLTALDRTPWMSRSAIAQRTGLTRATVSSLVDALLASGLVAEGEPDRSGPGRPSRPVAMNAEGPVAVGVEINVDYIHAAVLDLTGRLRVSARHDANNRDVPVVTLLDRAADLVAEVLAGNDRVLLGAGLAVPGVVSADGAVLRAPNLTQLVEHRLGDELALRLSVDRVALENEANLGALARLRSAPEAGDDFVYVSGEVGVGAGLITGGELFRGVNGFAGELGHVVVDQDGPDCSCGGRGCVEQYAGLDVLLRTSRQPDLESLRAAVARGDRRGRAAVQQAGSALGVGLSSLLNVFDLPQIVLGGVYAQLFDEITPSLMAELARRVLATRTAFGQIVRSALGQDAAVRGAAGLVLDDALRRPDELIESLSAPAAPLLAGAAGYPGSAAS